MHLRKTVLSCVVTRFLADVLQGERRGGKGGLPAVIMPAMARSRVRIKDQIRIQISYFLICRLLPTVPSRGKRFLRESSATLDGMVTSNEDRWKINVSSFFEFQLGPGASFNRPLCLCFGFLRMETPGNTGIPVCIVFLIQSCSDLVFVCISHSNLYSGLVFELCFCLWSSQDVTDDRHFDFDRNNFLCYLTEICWQIKHLWHLFVVFSSVCAGQKADIAI